MDTNKLNVRLGGRRSLLADGVQVRKWEFRSRTNSFTEESLEGVLTMMIWVEGCDRRMHTLLQRDRFYS